MKASDPSRPSYSSVLQGGENRSIRSGVPSDSSQTPSSVAASIFAAHQVFPPQLSQQLGQATEAGGRQLEVHSTKSAADFALLNQQAQTLGISSNFSLAMQQTSRPSMAATSSVLHNPHAATLHHQQQRAPSAFTSQNAPGVTGRDTASAGPVGMLHKPSGAPMAGRDIYQQHDLASLAMPTAGLNAAAAASYLAAANQQQQAAAAAAAAAAQQMQQSLKVEDALSYLEQVKVQFRNKPHIYNDFLDIMKEFKSSNIDTPGVIQRVSHLFRGYTNLVVGFNTFLPAGYKIEVNGECGERISILLPDGQSHLITWGDDAYPTQQQQANLPLGTLPNAAGSTSLLNHQQLLAGEGSAGRSVIVNGQTKPMAPGSASTVGVQPPLEFNQAISYVNKIKMRYITQPEVYKSFLDILHTYQKEQREIKEGIIYPNRKILTEREVYDMVAKLFAHEPDLLREFSQFLPDASSSTGFLHVQQQSLLLTPPALLQHPSLQQHLPFHQSQPTTSISRHQAPPPDPIGRSPTNQELASSSAGFRSSLTNREATLASIGRSPPNQVSPSTNYNAIGGRPSTNRDDTSVGRASTAIGRFAPATQVPPTAVTPTSSAYRNSTGGVASPARPSYEALSPANQGTPVGGAAPFGSTGGRSAQHVATLSYSPTKADKTPLAGCGRGFGSVAPEGVAKSALNGSGGSVIKRPFTQSPIKLEPSTSPPKKQFKVETVNHDLNVNDTVACGSLREYEFFDKIRKTLYDEESYQNFVRCLILYNQEIVSKFELVDIMMPFFNDYPEIMKWLRNFLNCNELGVYANCPGVTEASALSQDALNDTVECISRDYGKFAEPMISSDLAMKIDYDSCKRDGISYRALPASYVQPKSSGRTPLCDEVLNDTWVSFPSWQSEDSTFVSSKKSQYEECIYRTEEERFELDILIENNKCLMEALEFIQKRLALMNDGDAKKYQLDENLGARSKFLYKRALKRLYGHKTDDLFEGLLKNPCVAVPIILDRTKAKDKEWREAQKSFNKNWREQNEKHYWKSLDHQGINFKQNDFKFIRSKALLSQIENLYEERKEQLEEVGVENFSAGPHMELTYPNDKFVFYDVTDLIIHHVKRQASLQKSEKFKIKKLLKLTLPQLFGIQVEPLSDDECSDDSDDDDDDDVASVRSAADATPSLASASVGRHRYNVRRRGGGSSDVAATVVGAGRRPTLASNGLPADESVERARSSCATYAAEDVRVVGPLRRSTAPLAPLSMPSTVTSVLTVATGSVTSSTPAAKGRLNGGDSSDGASSLASLAAAARTVAKLTSPRRSRDDDDVVVRGGVRRTSHHRKDSVKKLADCQYSLMMMANPWYLFLRLHHLLNERLFKMKQLCESLKILAQKRKDSNVSYPYLDSYSNSDSVPECPTGQNIGADAQVGVARLSDTLPPADALKCRQKDSVLPEDYYSTLLQLIKNVLDGLIDGLQFEDSLRSMFIIHAYQSYTMDKIVQMMVKQLHAIVTDETSLQLMILYEKWAEKGGAGSTAFCTLNCKKFEEKYQQEAEKIVVDENCFKAYFLHDKRKLTIEMIKGENDEEDEESGNEEEETKNFDGEIENQTEKTKNRKISEKSSDENLNSTDHLDQNLSYAREFCDLNDRHSIQIVQQLLSLLLAKPIFMCRNVRKVRHCIDRQLKVDQGRKTSQSSTSVCVATPTQTCGTACACCTTGRCSSIGHQSIFDKFVTPLDDSAAVPPADQSPATPPVAVVDLVGGDASVEDHKLCLAGSASNDVSGQDSKMDVDDDVTLTVESTSGAFSCSADCSTQGTTRSDEISQAGHSQTIQQGEPRTKNFLKITYIKRPNEILFRRGAFNRARKLRLKCTESKNRRFGAWHERWILTNVSMEQARLTGDWFMGRSTVADDSAPLDSSVWIQRISEQCPTRPPTLNVTRYLSQQNSVNAPPTTTVSTAMVAPQSTSISSGVNR